MKARIAVAAFALAVSLSVVSAVSARTGLSPNATAPATVVLDWNANAVLAVRAATVVDPAGTAPRSIYQTEGELYMSYVQAAVYDAVTKIGHRYVPYQHISVGAGNASIEAAAISAAYSTLAFYLGPHLSAADNAGLAAKYQASIGALPDNKTTARGIAVGQEAAAGIEALRANDGRYAPSPVFGAGPLQPGLWVWAPLPSLQVAQTPWMATMQPFMLDSTSQFRAPAPALLTSDEYTKDYIETMDFGSKTSAVRTSEETKTAWFWNANAINQINSTLAGVASQHGMDIIDAARLLAAGNMIPTDAGMACFDSKYTYQRWRPLTAIQNALIDGNDQTHPDPGWTPLVTTPNHPEYPSQHGCVTSALMQVIANALGTDNVDVTIKGAENGLTTLTTSRTFTTVDDVDNEVIDARVWIGFHFRHSVIAGENLGKSVANWELQRYFQPTGEQGD